MGFYFLERMKYGLKLQEINFFYDIPTMNILKIFNFNWILQW